ncbi:MAG: alternative ribosome rescue aminoacyl-tRNA hydrolase ArfB [Paracoccaceae bacterium]|jgi:ribosome-associated protein|uniref:alternative ribosome rescue aminoacyl-tRNA hydrolase ArfB n=1 Tax=Candidatus Salinivivens marinus TaxID=3381703 RepID=UPI000B66A1BD|nr:aminoacyl-tRNA hydrolase [Marinovum sp.]NCV17678.1 aminoacyl-tRNA hydrolase [Rhodobacterales bacterium]NCX69979.1 aminoacyl-tRNA hydrolase [Paracoccaceae bacterium]OUU11010.1 MAG: aminoacyl-tRNA hydrolase [Rhodobacteraceae bacterium TMED38]PDH58696.1 MAG: aminoacyl-tRNA hydrolase [Rhodobacteraceae bacterium MED-G08]|tara:strand:+ start:1509 stop:1943 length:435 start_codon:yes stop_codon:yes gene_type:complete
MLKIDDKITIKSWELSEQFIRASGPGGQNVNKTSSAVELRFEAERSPSLSEPVKKRLKKIAGAKWTKEGAIVLKCDETRHQVRNREIVLKRLKEMIKKSLVTPKRRLATRPTLASNRRRLTAKKNRADLKSNRARISTKNIPLD